MCPLKGQRIGLVLILTATYQIMLRKDYQLLGRVFRPALEKFANDNLDLSGDELRRIKNYHEFLVKRLKEYIKEENSAFDEKRFLEE